MMKVYAYFHLQGQDKIRNASVCPTPLSPILTVYEMGGV
jgi:hypothetical protein